MSIMMNRNIMYEQGNESDKSYLFFVANKT
jgi:hypothetical protein